MTTMLGTGQVAMAIASGRVKVYLGLGSNLGDREANLQTAVRRLGKHVTVDALSDLYETPPMGPPDQPWYLNAACGGVTALTPEKLLAFVKRVEQQTGRVPSSRWGPRILDIDILFYGDCVYHDPELVIPHPGVHHRAFVLRPLADIAPDLIHPRLREPISALLKGCLEGSDQIRRIAERKEWYPCMK
jgi:2-amino-4-hydroxy-6-hydroxymethyldihydropteridine diphosphokinase